MSTTEFTARLSFEGFFYTAQCLEVDISAEGDTQEKAIENLRTQLMLQLRIPSVSIALECGYLPEVSIELSTDPAKPAMDGLTAFHYREIGPQASKTMNYRRPKP
jgi:hypothetical protein